MRLSDLLHKIQLQQTQITGFLWFSQLIHLARVVAEICFFMNIYLLLVLLNDENRLHRFYCFTGFISRFCSSYKETCGRSIIMVLQRKSKAAEQILIIYQNQSVLVFHSVTQISILDSFAQPKDGQHDSSFGCFGDFVFDVS